MVTDRRRLVVSGLSAGAVAAVAGCGPKDEAAPATGALGPLHCFLVENGAPGAAGFSVGMLSCRDPAAHVARLGEIRRRTRFRTELGFASTNRWKLAFLKPAFQHLAASPDLHGRVLSVAAVADWARRSEAQRRRLHFDAYRRLLQGLAPSERASAVLHLTPRSTGGKRDALLAEDLQTFLGGSARAALDGPSFGDLPALASAVFGSVRYAPRRGRSKTKRATVDMLAEALEAPGLAPDSLNRGGKIAAASAAL